MAVHECEVWVCVDVDGNYAVGSSDEVAREKYTEDVGDLGDCGGFRLVRVTVKVPMPVEDLAVDVPELPESSAEVK